MSCKAKDLPSQNELGAMFDYDFVSGRLTWKRREEMSSQWNGKHAGATAGSTKNGYKEVSIDNRNYRSHRIIWKLVFGSIPNDMQIDHADGDGMNNRLNNLRLVTNAENQRNRRADTGRKFKGVYKKGNGFKVELTHKGERLYLGYYDSERLAAFAYDEKARELHGEHANLNFPGVQGAAWLN